MQSPPLNTNINRGNTMTLKESQIICNKINGKYYRAVGSVKWDEVFDNEEQIIEALKKVYIPKSRTAPTSTFKGYEYIYSFAYYVQRGWTLSEKQMQQCKRLALEIKKASAIGDYKF